MSPCSQTFVAGIRDKSGKRALERHAVRHIQRLIADATAERALEYAIELRLLQTFLEGCGETALGDAASWLRELSVGRIAALAVRG